MAFLYNHQSSNATIVFSFSQAFSSESLCQINIINNTFSLGWGGKWSLKVVLT